MRFECPCVRAWDSLKMRESHAQCVRLSRSVVCAEKPRLLKSDRIPPVSLNKLSQCSCEDSGVHWFSLPHPGCACWCWHIIKWGCVWGNHKESPSGTCLHLWPQRQGFCLSDSSQGERSKLSLVPSPEWIRSEAVFKDNSEGVLVKFCNHQLLV